MSKFLEQLRVEIPRWQREYVFKSEVAPIYYKKGMALPPSYKKRITDKKYTWKNYNGAQTLWHVKQKKFILKNPKVANEPKKWNFNGQNFCSLHWRMKSIITDYYKHYFSGYVVQQLKTIQNIENKYISVSCDIVEIKHKDLPDVDNMWLLDKFFIDTLHENGIIPDDKAEYIPEAGKKSYIFVTDPKDRKLVFKINIYEK